MSAPLKYVGHRLKKAHRWKKEVSTSDWVEKNVSLSSSASPKPGSVDLDYTPHVKDIFDAFDRPEVSDICIESASQNAKTLILMSINAKIQCTEPCPIMFQTPLKDKIAIYVSQKVNTFNRGIKVYNAKIEDYKSDESIRLKDTEKKVAGGSTLYVGTTTTERKSFTIKTWIGDEIGEFPKGAVAETQERTKTYEKFYPKRIGASTIVHKEDELVTYAKKMKASAEFCFICPDCGESFYAGSYHLKWKSTTQYMIEKGITESEIDIEDYKEAAIESGHIECEHCQYKITNEEKDRLIYKGKGVEFVYVKGSRKATKIHFRMNSLTSWFVSLGAIIEEIIDAGEDPEKLDIAYRGWLSEFYEKQSVKTDENDMLLLGNNLKEWEVPDNTYKIYMGVDTQKDHFWYEVKAFCYGNISHTISWGRVESFADIEDIWEYGQHIEKGNEIYQISKMGIDRRGYNEGGVRRTDEVDAFVEYMVSKWKNGDENRIYATMGFPKITGDKSFQIQNSKDYSNNRNKTDIKVVKISNIYMKNTVQRAIERTILKKQAETEDDEGFLYEAKLFYVNQETIEADMKGTIATSYTRQYTAEVYDYAINPKTKKIDTEKSWFMPTKTDNHLFDTGVICYTFAEIDKINLQRQMSSEGIADTLSGLANLGE